MKIADIERAMDKAAGRAVTIHPDGTMTFEADERDAEIESLRAQLAEVNPALVQAEKDRIEARDEARSELTQRLLNGSWQVHSDGHTKAVSDLLDEAHALGRDSRDPEVDESRGEVVMGEEENERLRAQLAEAKAEMDRGRRCLANVGYQLAEAKAEIARYEDVDVELSSLTEYVLEHLSYEDDEGNESNAEECIDAAKAEVAEHRRCAAQLADARAALKFIAQQGCERTAAECRSTGDCVTEFCLPCYAEAHVRTSAEPEGGSDDAT